MLDQYPYLFAVLLGLPAVALGFALVPGQRLMMLISGATLTAFAPLLFLYEGNYWTPPRLLGGVFGIEDVLMNFSIGSLMWLFAVLAVRRPVHIHLSTRAYLARIVLVLGLGLATMLILDRMGTGMMMAGIIVGFGMAAAIVLIRPNLTPLLIGSCVLYAPYYYLVLYTAGAFSSTFFDMWNGPELLGPRIMGLPIEEVIFPFSFAGYPIAIAYAADATVGEFVGQKQHTAAS